MKICFIVGAFPNMKCGVGDYAHKLVLELIENNIDISVITSSQASISNEKIDLHNNVEKWNFRHLKHIIKEVKSIKPDLVHIQYPSNEYKKNVMINLLPLIIRQVCKCKVISTVHEYSATSKLGKIRNFISMKLSNQTVVVEKRYIEDVNKHFKNFAQNVILDYIPIFSNIPKYNMNQVELDKLREKIGLNNSKVISYFGFLNPNKGFENIIEVLKRFRENNENVKVLFIGGIDSKVEYHKEILEKISNYGLKEDIIVTDFIEDPQMVANYLKISDVCMLPFRDGVSERNGSFLAAYIQNIPIVTTCIEGNRVEDEVYYVKPEDINKQYEIIKDILNNAKILVSREEKNSVNYVAKKYLEIYKKNNTEG